MSGDAEEPFDRVDGEVDDEGGGDHPEQPVDVAAPAPGRLDGHVGDESGPDAVARAGCGVCRSVVRW